jgi:hypothetical protein
MGKMRISHFMSLVFYFLSFLPTHLPTPGRWVAKLVARLLATAALWVRNQTSYFVNGWQDANKK